MQSHETTVGYGYGKTPVHNLKGSGKYDRAVVLMTALIPTIGHKNLIGYASALADKVTVIISTRNCEPIPGYVRFREIEGLPFSNVSVYHHGDNDAPQNPNLNLAFDDEFWAYWRKVVTSAMKDVNYSEKIAFVASENYGLTMAMVMGWDFIPYDMIRQIHPAKGTDIRNSLLTTTDNRWAEMLPLTQSYLQTRVCLFGAESCGKTTMARYLADSLNGYFIPEWARDYLNLVDNSLSNRKMDIIAEGQHALEISSMINLSDKPFLFFDTDLFSTYGYYNLFDKNFKEPYSTYPIHRHFIKEDITFGKLKKNVRSFFGVSKDIYIVMNDKIPFEADPLRYGGDKRQSPTDYWIDLLKEYEQKYYVVEETDPVKQQSEIADVVWKTYAEKINKVVTFERD